MKRLNIVLLLIFLSTSSLVAKDTTITKKSTWTKAEKEEWIKKFLKRKKQNKQLDAIINALEKAKNQKTTTK